MKHYLDYKKQYNIFLIIVLVVLPVFFVYGDTASELRNKIQQKDNDIAKLEQEIAAYQSEINGLSKQKDSLNRSLEELNLTRKKLVADISVTEKKIDRTNFTIATLSSDIDYKQDVINTNIESIELEIRKINEFEQNTLLEIILSDKNFGEIWNDIDNIVAVREQIRENLSEVKETKSKLEGTRAETIDARAELRALKAELSDQRKIVQQNADEKNRLLKETRNSEANYQKLVQDRRAKIDAFERELQAFEAQLKFILDPSKLPSGGVLSWPLDKIFVTSPFGPRWGRLHGGTDFRASVGTPVKAMADGVVKGVGNTDLCCPGASLGKWIFIEHGNGLSSNFGHLSLIRVKEGQRVKRGEVVGYTGNTGSSTGPHLHASVYVSDGVKVDSFQSKSYPGRTLTQPVAARNAYLDPMIYLPPL